MKLTTIALELYINTNMSINKLEPPSFVSETKSFDTYKKDLLRWSKLTSLKPESQALMVIHCLDGDPSNIKDKIDAGIKDEDLSSEKGINTLLEFLAKIYKKDTLADSFDKYMKFDRLKRKPNSNMQDFISEWAMAYKKTENAGCTLSPAVLAFKLLDAANLSPIETNLVLTGVNYEGDDLQGQMERALKKFVG